MRIMVLIVLLLLPASMVFADVQTDPFGFSEDDYSSWGIIDAPYPFTGVDAEGNKIGYGCFPVGNGQVFAHLGVDGDFNTLRGITGPSYQTRDDDGKAVWWQEGDWLTLRFDLLLPAPGAAMAPGIRYSDGHQTPEWRTQSVQTIRGCPMVRVWQSNGTDELYSLTYAIPFENTIVREFALVGSTDSLGSSSIRIPLSAEIDAQENNYAYASGPKRFVISGSYLEKHGDWTARIYAVEDSWQTKPCFRFYVIFEFYELGNWPVSWVAERHFNAEEDRVDTTPKGRLDLLVKYRDFTRKYWKSWSSQNMSFDTGDPRLDDMMAQLPVIIETQRDAYSGGVAPLVSYHGYWVRDSMGPMLMYMANRRFDVVKRMLRYYRAASLHYGHCHMQVPLDLNLSSLPGWVPDVGAGLRPAQGGPEPRPYGKTAGDLSAIGTNAVDWEGVSVEHAEVPSLIVLQHYLLWREMHSAGYGGDADEFITEAWPFLAHNLFSMDFDPKYGAKFHGDETYAHGALYSTYDRDESGQIGYPNGYIPTDYFSFDNTLLHWSAAASFLEMANSLDRPAEKDARKLAYRLQSCLHSYLHPWNWLRRGCTPAISPVTEQRWPSFFSNMSLAGHSLALNHGSMATNSPYTPSGIEHYAVSKRIGSQYSYAAPALHQTAAWHEAREPLLSWWTTPWSGYVTGHALGTWLNAARNNANKDACSEIVSQLLACASPEGAWCEVLNPQGMPVDIYGRTNRIRPWESGVNYLMLAAWLSEQGQLAEGAEVESQQRALSLLTDGYLRDRRYWDEIERWSDHPRYSPSWFGFYNESDVFFALAMPQAYTQLFVLTVDNHYKELIALDDRFRDTEESQITAWDAGLPFGHTALRQALLTVGIVPVFSLDSDITSSGTRHDETADAETGGHGGSPLQEAAESLRIPYLCFDRGVRGGLDRRTFKDEEFWYGEEMTQLLADYEAAGGTVIDEDSLELSLVEDEVVALRLLVVLFTHAFNHEMSAEEIARFHSEVAGWISWYDDVAGDRLRLELSFMQIDQRLAPRMCGPQGDNVFWMGYSDVEEMLRSRGVPDDYYDSVTCFWTWDRDFIMANGEKAHQAYGGAAQGPGDDVDFLGEAGRTSYFGAAVLISHPDGPSKVAIHEYLHNVDAMFEAIGDPRLSHPDHMARNMETLLSEVPGSFERWGYSDDEMREMAKAELRREASFPWSTQLVYYEQALKRIPREDYARLLTRFGRRAQREERKHLYDSFLLPRGVEPYQVYFEETPGMARLRAEDIDSAGQENLVWEATLWTGDVPEDAEEPVRHYNELELLCDDVMEFVIGEDDGPIHVWLTPTHCEDGYALADVCADINGETHQMQSVGGGAYAFELPDGLAERTPVVFHAEAGGYACSPVPVELHVRPAWEIAADCTLNERDEPGLLIGVDGPDGYYRLDVRLYSEMNTVQELLHRDGFFPRYEINTNLNLHAGSEVFIPFGDIDAEACEVLMLIADVEYSSPDGGTSRFAHRFPPARNLSTLLADVPAEELPEYIPIAYPREVDQGAASACRRTLYLAPENGNIFDGQISDAGDASLELEFRYDDDFLYVNGAIRDDMITSRGCWDSDRVNLVFDTELNTTPDAYPEGPTGHSGWQRDDYWVFLVPFAESGPMMMRMGGERPSGSKNGYYGNVVGSEAEVESTEDGYSFTWRIPWESLPYFEPVPGQLVGFTLFYSDYDEGLAELMYLTDWGGPDGIEWRYWDCGLLYFAE